MFISRTCLHDDFFKEQKQSFLYKEFNNIPIQKCTVSLSAPLPNNTRRIVHFYVLLENMSLGFLARSHTNRAIQSQKMARGLKSWI